MHVIRSKWVQDAADGAPEPPQALQVFPAGYDAIYLMWSEPSSNSDVDHYYVYVEGEDNDYTTTDRYCLVNNLEACTNYIFGVRSVSASGDMSDPLLGEGQTDVGPPPAPQNLQVDNFMSTSVTLTWDEPDTLCDVEEYLVKWSKDGTTAQDTRVTETSYTVTSLTKNTTYTFSVSASTSYGIGPEATVEQTTPFHGGGPPEDLVATGVSTSAINASWSPPADKPNYYVVAAPPCMFLEQIVYDLSYLITGLDPCQSCSISVTSRYEQSIEYTASTMGTSKSGDPPQPDGCSVAVQENAIVVTWDRPSSNCQQGPYRVNWTWTKLWGDGEEESDSRTTPGTKLNVLDPVPYTEYSFEVSTSIDGVFGSPASCSGTSVEALPGPPVILAVDSVQGKALVTWEPPAEENGVIVNYEIYVDEKTEPDATVNGESLSTSVELEPCKSFNLSVKARNGKGLGPASEKLAVTVVDDALPGKVDCAAGEFQVEVCWEPYSKTCPVSQYNLEWEGDVLWSEDLEDSNSTTMEWSDTRTCYTIPSLPYTEYYVELSVGSGTEHKSCSSITPMAAPGPPSDVALTIQDLTINVTWTEPEEKNGIIDIYKVEWKNSTGIIGSHTTEDNSTFSYTILELLCGMTVDVTVSAKVETVDEFGAASPLQTADLVNTVLPEKVDCTAGEFQVEVCWEPYYKTCPVSQYNLEWEGDVLWSEDLEDSNSTTMEWSETRICYTIPALPYTEYYFELSVGSGANYRSCSDITPMAAPGPPSDVVLTTEDLTINVTWTEPEEKNGIIDIYKVEWKNSTGIISSHTTEDNSTFSYTILELLCGMTVDVTVSAKVETVDEFGAASPLQTADLVNSGLPEKVDCAAGEFQVEVCWEPYSKTCPVSQYNLEWEGDVLWSEDLEGSNSTTMEWSETRICYTIPSLPYTEYYIQLTLDSGTETRNCSGITPMAAASPPTELMQVAMDVSSVTVQWSLPESMNGILNGWYLSWTSAIGHYLGEQHVTNPDERAHQIGDLDPSEIYNVYVMAVNGAGKGEAAMLETRTEYVP